MKKNEMMINGTRYTQVSLERDMKREERREREERLSKKSRAAVYAACVEIGLIFEDYEFGDAVARDTFFLYYQEENRQTRSRLRQQILRKVRPALAGAAARLAEMRCSIRIDRAGANYLVWFLTGFESVMALVEPGGNVEVVLVPWLAA